MRIAITSCEISQDFQIAIAAGVSWGIRNYELRRVGGRRVSELSLEEMRQLRGMAEAHGARIVATSPGIFLGIPVSSLEQGQHAGALLRHSIESAQVVGAEKLVIFSFARPLSATPDTPCPSAVVEVLGQAAETIHTEGLEPVLENLPGGWADTGRNAARVLEMVGGVLKANWDPANAYSAGEARPFPDGYEPLAPFVAHLHLKNVATVDGKHGYRPLSEGVIDWPGQLVALSAIGYKGYLTIETHAEPLMECSRANLEQLKGMLTSLALQLSTAENVEIRDRC